MRFEQARWPNARGPVLGYLASTLGERKDHGGMGQSRGRDHCHGRIGCRMYEGVRGKHALDDSQWSQELEHDDKAGSTHRGDVVALG